MYNWIVGVPGYAEMAKMAPLIFRNISGYPYTDAEAALKSLSNDLLDRYTRNAEDWNKWDFNPEKITLPPSYEDFLDYVNSMSGWVADDFVELEDWWPWDLGNFLSAPRSEIIYVPERFDNLMVELQPSIKDEDEEIGLNLRFKKNDSGILEVDV